MKHKEIITKEDYDIALKRFEEIFNADMGTKEGEEAMGLSYLIEDYENKHYKIDAPKCPNCVNGELEFAKASEPYTNEHLICNKCDSTYPM